jgi:Zn-dependent protease
MWRAARLGAAVTSAARLAASANPLVRPLADAVEYTVERWADECAAAAVGDRRLVAETIAHAALAAKARRPRRPLAAALGAVFGRPGGPAWSQAGPVPRRVAALLGAPPPRRVLLMAAGAGLIVLAAVCALEAANDLQDLLSLAHATASHRSRRVATRTR